MTARSTVMTTNKIFLLALLVLGIVLLVLGVNAADSISSSFSRLFTGQPTDKAVWLLIGGCVATLAGLGGLRTDAK